MEKTYTYNNVLIREIDDIPHANIVVSVCMITYNHEDYISEAIEGVLMQQTNFPFELVIGEDCSTDRTRQICLEYQKKYPHIIRLLLPEKNLGMISNFMLTLKACKGEYIAMCEGDDYWTDAFKLKKQVEFLNENMDYSACCHNVTVNNQIERRKYLMWPWNEEISFSKYDLALGNKISTLSLVFRNYKDSFYFLTDVFSQYPDSPAADYVLNLFLAQKGNIKYFPQDWGTYRVHGSGILSTTAYNSHKYTLLLIRWIRLLMILTNYLDKTFEKYIKTQLIYIYDKLRLTYYRTNKVSQLCKISLLQLKYIKYWEKSRIRLFFSILYRILLSILKKLKPI